MTELWRSLCEQTEKWKCLGFPFVELCNNQRLITISFFTFLGGQGSYIPPLNYPESSSTQRLVISCMSVLVIVSLLLFFSRNIVHRRSNYNLSARERYLQSEPDYTDGKLLCTYYFRRATDMSTYQFLPLGKTWKNNTLL